VPLWAETRRDQVVIEVEKQYFVWFAKPVEPSSNSGRVLASNS
jgi:hypothetical protein